jgi:hypothetical protein
MRRPRLAAFHVTMAITYLVIARAYQAGCNEFGFAVWSAALATCVAILVICAITVISAWRSSGSPLPLVRWFRQQLK